ADHVADRVVAHVAHVQRARRIREHRQAVILLARRVFLHLERMGVGPELLRGGFNGAGVVGAAVVGGGVVGFLHGCDAIRRQYSRFASLPQCSKSAKHRRSRTSDATCDFRPATGPSGLVMMPGFQSIRGEIMRTRFHRGIRRLPLTFAIAALTITAAQAAEAPTADAAPAPEVTVIHCAHLIDTVAGKMLGATSIVIDGQRIKEVVAGSVTRDGAKVIDMPATDTCMPGLVDSHTHLTSQFSKSTYSDQFRLNPADYAIESTVFARRTLLAGFTTVRNLGESDNSSIALRNAINKGEIPGPRI